MELLNIYEESQEDNKFYKELESNISDLIAKTLKFEIKTILSNKEDSKNAILSINSGAGGTEAQDWANMLCRMYFRYSEINNFKVEFLDKLEGDEAGIKNCTILIKGDYSYGFLKNESGVHRLVRISPFDSNKRRHTSFASVSVTPEVDENIDIEINSKDLKIDTFRAGGAGGQHLNKTDSAVRITHIPSGLVVSCQNQRSQHQNKSYAMKILSSKLYEIEVEKKKNMDNQINSSKKEISWGSQIRSYILHPYRMVKDHRTNDEIGNVDSFLDGDLNNLIESLLSKIK
tara:strand:+ start:2603 stop:3466 length:864 start_codon:yes stop_codon:yes gene_type:complete